MVARRAHNPKVVGSNPIPAIIIKMKKFVKTLKKGFTAYQFYDIIYVYSNDISTFLFYEIIWVIFK